MYSILDKTLKGIRGVRLDNRKVLRVPGPGTKLFERFFLVKYTVVVFILYYIKYMRSSDA